MTLQEMQERDARFKAKEEQAERIKANHARLRATQTRLREEHGIVSFIDGCRLVTKNEVGKFLPIHEVCPQHLLTEEMPEEDDDEKKVVEPIMVAYVSNDEMIIVALSKEVEMLKEYGEHRDMDEYDREEFKGALCIQPTVRFKHIEKV